MTLSQRPDFKINMQLLTRFLIVATLCLTVSCSSVKETAAPADYSETYRTVSEYIEHMPVDRMSEQAWLNEQLLATGREGLVVLTGMLTGPDTGDDRRARYALSSLATWVTQPGLGAEKALFEETLLEQFDQVHAEDARIFLIRQLEVAGSDRSVPLMAQLLHHDTYYPYALRLLTTLNTESAVVAIREAQAEAEGAAKVAMIYALGDLEDRASVEVVLPFATSEDWQLRRSALYLLSTTPNGNPAVSRQFASGVELAEGDVERTESVALYTAYTANLAAAGHAAEAERVSRSILETYRDAQVRSSALTTLADVTGGEQLLADLVRYYLSDEPGGQFGGTALHLASKVEGSQATAALVSALDSAPASHQARLLYALGDREDSQLIETVAQRLGSTNPAVSAAAAEALFRLGGENQLQTVMRSLLQAESGEKVAAIESVLMQFPTDALTAMAAGSLPDATQQARPALIRILTARQADNYIGAIVPFASSSDRSVRSEVWRALQVMGGDEHVDPLLGSIPSSLDGEEQAAIRSALTTIINRSDNPDALVSRLLEPVSEGQHPWLVAILPGINGVGTDHLDGLLNAPDQAVQVAAIRTLGQWHSTEAMPLILRLIPRVSGQERQALAEGYIRLVGQTGGSASEKASLLRDLAETAGTSEERAAIIGYFSSADGLAGLQAAAGYFTSSDVLVSEQAFEVATERLSTLLESSAGSLGENERIELYNTALAMVDSSARDRLVHYLQGSTDSAESGVVTVSQQTETEVTGPLYGSLFNGEDLDGWEPVGANPDAWGAEGGILYTDGVGSGWLSTRDQYDNFEMELEYRVPEGGNSGVFLRTPREGNPAYQGLEIQILDDYAERYADLQPYQYTGSIYNIKAPSRRVTQPAGEWQHMKITADGPRIQVEVNGELIVNTSLVHHMEHVEGHPGLTRRRGYIGLQNHSSRVDFRNIIIREIDPNDE